MTTLSPADYYKVLPLITSNNDLTVFAALNNIIKGTVIVDNPHSPSCALIKTPGSNFIAGDANNTEFINSIHQELDFWDQLTPDNVRWIPIIPKCHPNKFIRQYTRCHYELPQEKWVDINFPTPQGYLIEKADIHTLRRQEYLNRNDVLDWAADYLDDNSFILNGIGHYARANNTITHYSLSDGHYKNKIAIGVLSKEEFRRKGLAAAVVSTTIRECFSKGFTTIEWLCVNFNKGSRAVAEKLGFKLVNTYASFSPYPPCENVLDLSEQEWADWAEYYEAYSAEEPRLLGEQLLAYIKADNNIKAKETLLTIAKQKDMENSADNINVAAYVPNMIGYFHSIGMCQNISREEWDKLLLTHGLLK